MKDKESVAFNALGMSKLFCKDAVRILAALNENPDQAAMKAVAVLDAINAAIKELKLRIEANGVGCGN